VGIRESGQGTKVQIVCLSIQEEGEEEMTLSSILELLDFSQPIQISTKNGIRLLRKASPTREFWDAYSCDKPALSQEFKKLGIRIGQFRNSWEVSWWSQPDFTFPAIHDFKLDEVDGSIVNDIPDLPPLIYPENLFEYQITSVQLGLRSMQKYNRALLGHGTGMGKTAIALAIARERGQRVAVVCPKPIVTDWHRMAKYLGVETYEVCGWEWVKTGKSKIGRWTDKSKKTFKFFLPPDVDLIFDEVHRGKGLKTQNSFLIRDAVFQNIPSLALSATIADDPTKMWAIGMFLNLHKGADYYPFLMRNDCVKTPWGMQFRGGLKTLRKIHKQIFPDRGNRLKPSDVGDAFPETLICARAFDMESAGEIAMEYDRLLLRIDELREQEHCAANILAEQTRARQAIELLKAPAVCSLAQDLVEEGNSVFIAVNYVETLKFMQSELNTKCTIQGGQDELVRRGNIDSFQNDKSRIIIGIIQACREGLNLHDVNGKYPRIALIMPTYSVFDLKQVLGRVHRAGGKSKSIQYLIYAANVDIEEDICGKLDKKLKQMDQIMDGEVDASISLVSKSKSIN
jgi:superfamily II DNA or RNA helicase